ncbi:MAG: hypothetical protein J6Q05_04390 [Elusimicrobiaceae bacterium]|nr:hypothetical protein [Elusimicrobiaceae bacterium]
MKLTSKWLLWFVLVALYAAIIGGLFYYNLFKFVFDTKLQNEMVEMVRFRTPQLVQGLAAKPKQVSFNEASQIKDILQNDARVKSIIYLNYDGSIRWHENTKFMGMSYADYNNSVGFDSNASVLAIRNGVPRAILTAGGDSYDMAIPLLAKGNTVAGVLDLTVSRAAARGLIRSSMVRYTVGAIIILALIGGVLYLFLLLKIIRPLVTLKDSIEAVSLNNLKLRYEPPKDEVGDVAVAVEGLLGKITEDIKGLENMEIMSLEKEKTWWKAVFAVTVPKGTRALVVDENNNVLYTNFELKVTEKRKVHLLDIFDGRQQEIIRVIGEALEKPTKVLRGNVKNNDVKCIVKAVQLPDDAGKNRIVVVLEPED